jgi:hypothetical protein
LLHVFVTAFPQRQVVGAVNVLVRALPKRSQRQLAVNGDLAAFDREGDQHVTLVDQAFIEECHRFSSVS